ncbi:putative membrane protein [Campylobacter gracilis]|nr:putative membrane protein [Campylobacter gracilis]
MFIFAFLFIAAIFFVRDEILSKRAKIIATALIVLLCAGAYLYESVSEHSAKLEEEMVFKFNAGARLRCGGAINFASEARGSANSSPETRDADAKNLGAQAGEANLNAQDKVTSTAQSSTAQTNEQASAAQINGAASGGQNSAQSPTLQNSAEPGQNFKSQNSTKNLDVASQNSTQQNDTQNLAPQNSASQGGMRSSISQNSAQRDDTQISDPQGSAQNFNAAEKNSMQGSTAQNSKATQNFAADKEQGSAQIVTRESFTYSFSLGAFIAKKSAGAEFRGKTYKIKECVYDQ